jgi:hypothetical protein
MSLETRRMCVYLRYTFVVVPKVSVETRIMCIHVYHSVVLVPGDPLRSYHGNLAGVISSALQWDWIMSDIVSCHLAAFRGSPSWERTAIVRVCIRYKRPTPLAVWKVTSYGDFIKKSRVFLTHTCEYIHTYVGTSIHPYSYIYIRTNFQPSLRYITRFNCFSLFYWKLSQSFYLLCRIYDDVLSRNTCL